MVSGADRRPLHLKLGLLVELLERFAILGFPSGKSVCTPAVYNDGRRRWTRKLRILGEDQEAIFLDKCAINGKFFALD